MTKKDYCAIAVILSALIAALLITPLLPYAVSTEQTGSTVVVNMWHIESYEGGNGSRSGWLNKRLLSYERQNKTTLISLSCYTPQQAIDKLAIGESFDLVSFGIGAGNVLLPYLQEYSGSVGAVADELVNGGCIGDRQYAVAYMAGIYALFARSADLAVAKVTDLTTDALNIDISRKVGHNTIKLQSLQGGFAQYNNALMALAQAGARGVYQADYELSQYAAYERFVKGNTSAVLLGTQRDMYRLGNRVAQGKLSSIECSVLPQYTDLVQYLAIGKRSAHADIAIKLIEYFVSDAVQHTIAGIYMLSVTGRQLYNDNQWFAQAQLCIGTIQTDNVFCDSIVLQQNRAKALSIINEQSN